MLLNLEKKVIFFHNILNCLATSYLQSYLLCNCAEPFYQTSSSGQSKYKSVSARTKTFESFLYPYCFKEWNNLSKKIRNIELEDKSKKTFLSFNRPKENSFFAVHDTNSVKLLTRLRLNLTHLNYRKFRHGFRNLIDHFVIFCFAIYKHFIKQIN